MLLETGYQKKPLTGGSKQNFCILSLLVWISQTVFYILVIKTKILSQEDTKVLLMIIIYTTF